MTSGSQPGLRPSYPVEPVAVPDPDFEPDPREYVVIMRAPGTTAMWCGTHSSVHPDGTPINFEGSRERVIDWAVNQVGAHEVLIWSDAARDVVPLATLTEGS